MKNAPRWTDDEDLYLRASFALGETWEQIALAVRRTAKGVKTRCQKLGLVTRRHFTSTECATIRTLHGSTNAREIAQRVGRSVSSVHQAIARLGLASSRTRHGVEFDAFVREHHALGWSDTQIAAEYSPRVDRKVDRHTVGDRRVQLGLASVLHSEHQRARTRANTRRQLDRAGLASMAQLRLKAWADAARRLGWPDDLRPRELQILHALYTIGPMTRREIADAVGMPWKGTRHSLHSNAPEGSYLATLISRGLAVDIGRSRRGPGIGKGHPPHIYSLPLHVQPNQQQPAVAPEESNHAA